MKDNAKNIIGHVIDGDAWLPVHRDGDAYTVDLGGAQGMSDTIAIDGTASDALAAIAAELSDELGYHVGYATHARYEVCVFDGRENVGTVYESRHFDTLEAAYDAFDELRRDFPFDEHDELWLFEDAGDGCQVSVDGCTAADRS